MRPFSVPRGQFFLLVPVGKRLSWCVLSHQQQRAQCISWMINLWRISMWFVIILMYSQMSYLVCHLTEMLSLLLIYYLVLLLFLSVHIECLVINYLSLKSKLRIYWKRDSFILVHHLGGTGYLCGEEGWYSEDVCGL